MPKKVASKPPVTVVKSKGVGQTNKRIAKAESKQQSRVTRASVINPKVIASSKKAINRGITADANVVIDQGKETRKRKGSHEAIASILVEEVKEEIEIQKIMEVEILNLSDGDLPTIIKRRRGRPNKAEMAVRQVPLMYSKYEEPSSLLKQMDTSTNHQVNDVQIALSSQPRLQVQQLQDSHSDTAAFYQKDFMSQAKKRGRPRKDAFIQIIEYIPKQESIVFSVPEVMSIPNEFEEQRGPQKMTRQSQRLRGRTEHYNSERGSYEELENEEEVKLLPMERKGHLTPEDSDFSQEERVKPQATRQTLLRQQMLHQHLYKRGPTKYQKASNDYGLMKGHWTKDEDFTLGDAVKKHSGRNWKRIAESLNGRTDVQCLHRWQKVLNPSLVKGPWTDEEDRLVLHLVHTHGPQKWTQIAEHLPGRIGKQCRERWHNHLNPKIKKIPWTPEEEWLLFLYHRRIGNKWAEMAKVLDGRTDNTIKNHWNSSMKKRIPELLEIYDQYMRQQLQKRNIAYLGHSLIVLGNSTSTYQKLIDDIERELISVKIEAVKNQSREYFSSKPSFKEHKKHQESDSMTQKRINTRQKQLVKSSSIKYLKNGQRVLGRKTLNVAQRETVIQKSVTPTAKDIEEVQVIEQIRIPSSNMIKIDLQTNNLPVRPNINQVKTKVHAIIKHKCQMGQHAPKINKHVDTPQSNKENYAGQSQNINHDINCHYEGYQSKFPRLRSSGDCCRGHSSSNSAGMNKHMYHALMNAQAVHCSSFKMFNEPEETFKPYMNEHNSLSHLLRGGDIMNTPPTNGTKTQGKFHLVASNNPKCGGLFSCTPKNETLRSNKEDEFRPSSILNFHNSLPMTIGHYQQPQQNIQKFKGTRNTGLLLHSPPQSSTLYDHNILKNRLQSPNLLLTQINMLHSNESLKQSQGETNQIKCPKPTVHHNRGRPQSPLAHPVLGTQLSLQRSNSRNRFQHENQRSAFTNITNNYNPKANLQFDNDVPLPPPLLPSHSTVAPNYDSPGLMLKYTTQLSMSNSMLKNGSHQSKHSSHINNLQASSSQSIKDQGKGVVGMSSIFLQTPPEGESMFEQYYAGKGTGVINISPFFSKH